MWKCILVQQLVWWTNSDGQTEHYLKLQVECQMNTLWLKQTQRVSSCYLFVTVHVHKKTSSCAENTCIITVTQNATWLLFKVPSSKAKLSLCVTTHTHTHKQTNTSTQAIMLANVTIKLHLSFSKLTNKTHPPVTVNPNAPACHDYYLSKLLRTSLIRKNK